ncbi:MAG: acyclic terpene utilization AtuA family protein [Acidimicrobiales bacterium]
MTAAAAGRRAEPLLIANCSGFFGDRLSAAGEMVDGGPIDVLTGDWLAELTMYILHKTRARSGGGGYARTFLRQMEEVLPTCVERGIRVVSNAGGLDPEGLADAVAELADRQGVRLKVASVAGDDIAPRLGELVDAGERFTNMDTGEDLPAGAAVVTANAYLGGAPIAAALEAGADVVVTGRVTDASLVVGPGIWAFGWGPEDLDRLAGAVVAGHVIECGAQCCGGNYAFFEEIPGMDRVGFPLAELAADGSAVITKHPGTGGAVTIGTVTAQLLYEIGGPRYLSPDAVARFDTIVLSDDGPDRVRLSGVRGEPSPRALKVTANLAGGWRNAMTTVITGPHPEAKARVAEDAIWAAVPGGRSAFAETSTELYGDVSGEGIACFRVAVRGEHEALVGRAFSSAVVETTLAGYPGTFATGAPGGAQEVARYWPTTVAAGAVRPEVLVDGKVVPVAPGWSDRAAVRPADPQARPDVEAPGPPPRPGGTGHRVSVPLGVLVGARSGDKGGNANVGVWADTDAVFAWMADELDEALLRRLLPEAEDLVIDRFVLANLRALNFVVHGILGWGVASNLRLDSQAKGLGEQIRSRTVTVPAVLAATGPPARRLDRWSRASDPPVG